MGISGSENQLAVNRATRWNDLNTISYKYTLGPEKSTNLTTYEKLERPIIKTFQKHPGNQVPEAQEMHKVCFNLVLAWSLEFFFHVFFNKIGLNRSQRISRKLTSSHKNFKNNRTTIGFEYETERRSTSTRFEFTKKTQGAGWSSMGARQLHKIIIFFFFKEQNNFYLFI